MTKQPIYVKFNSYRRPEFALATEILCIDGKYNVFKFAANEKSKKFLKNLVSIHSLLEKSDLPIKTNNVKSINSNLTEIEYIKGETMLNELRSCTKSFSKKRCLEMFREFSKLLDDFPIYNESLSEDFKKVFGGEITEEKYEVVKPGVLDLNLDNIMRERNGELTLIDFEWTFRFGIPKRYILYRTIYGSYKALKETLSKTIQIEEYEKEFGFTKDEIERYLNWEANFQYYVTGRKSKTEDLMTIRNPQPKERAERYLSKKTYEKELGQKYELLKKDEREKWELLKQELITTNKKTQKLRKEKINLQESLSELQLDTEEFRIFRQTKMWRLLTFCRKLKKYTRNFFINIFKDGPIRTFKRIFSRIKKILEIKKQKKIDANRYLCWLKNNKITPLKRATIKKETEQLEYQPLISIIMPVYNVELKWIKKAINSIKEQIYTNWELCIADDASTNPKLIEYLKRLEKNKKIKIVFRKKNGHISEASNSALKLAKGDFVALMDNDDIIHPHALADVVKVLNRKKDTDLIYSDEDKITVNEKRVEPFFKPDWSPDLFLSSNYLCHLTVIRKKLVDDVGGFRKGYEGSQDYDLFLRVIEKTNNIEHIPDILYSWRKIPGSTASKYAHKGYADKASLKALSEAMERRKINATVETGLFPGSFRVKYQIEGNPLVSILIPTLDKYEYIERCISSIFEKTTYENFEVIIIDTGSTEKKTLKYYKSLKDNHKIKFLYWKERFNYSAVNNYGVKNSKGEYILLLNNDTEVITPDWIEGMLEHAQREEIGAVGVKLYYPNGTIQHAGVVLGINGGSGRGVAGHAFKRFSKEIKGFPIQKDVIKNYSAVTAACLMVNRKKYNEVNGLDEKFRIAFNDVDFCLKLRDKDYYNIYTPYVELYHHESVSVGIPEDKSRDIEEFSREIDLIYEKWGDMLLNDEFYNRNLTLLSEDYAVVTNKN